MKKMNWLGVVGFILWAPIPWLYLGRPAILAGQPLAVYAVGLFLAGLSLTSAALYVALKKKMTPGRARLYVFLFILAFVGAYQFSGLAPSWQCFGKKIQAAVGKAAGQNCTTTCTDNDKKPCSGWSTCWDKFVSCSSAGKDQDGRGCNGCCFSCDVVCEEDDPPAPTYQPPTISGTVACSQAGNNGWCIGASTLYLSASDPQGFALTISGTINGSVFTCAAGNTCNLALPEGNGSITYQVTAATSGLSSATGSTTWKRDVTAPAVNAIYPSVNGLNGWHVAAPVAVSAAGSDALSGLASAQVSVNGGGWQSSASLGDGIYMVNFRTADNAGNSSSVSRTIKVDSTLPAVIPVVPSPDGLNDWFITAPVNVTAIGSDAGSGLASALVSVNGGNWQPSLFLSDGVYTVDFKSTDNAGNTATATRAVKVDASLPVIVTTIDGTVGGSGWYVSQTTTSITADELSGIDHIEYNENGTGWQKGVSFVSEEGINQIDIKVYDSAGNVATRSLEIKVDTTPPLISTSIIGTRGLADWYASQTETMISARDDNSGVDRIDYNQNDTGWQEGSSVVSNDGVNTIGIKAYDLAGNVTTDSLEIKVDTIAPSISPIVPSPDGANGWFVTAPVAVSASGSDSGSGLASALASVDGGKWEPNTLLSDGVYTVEFRSTDKAGNSTTTSRTVKVDTVPPLLSTSISGTAGNNGWYVNQTNTDIVARDETSGIDRIEYDQNDTGWKEGALVSSQDGINEIVIKAHDMAGNVAQGSLQVKVDTVRPTSQFSSPRNGSTNTLVRGNYSLSGSSADTTSGVAAAEISLNSKTWLPLVISSSNTWIYDWDTLSWGDGVYPVVVRTTDVAGNTELVESGAHVSLIVNNAPPHIKLTPEWLIWNSGTLVITTEYFPVRNGTIVIADKEGRWPEVRIPFGEKYPEEIRWDRRFANGILAPSGDYRVTVSACNVYNFCSERDAMIRIPWYAPVIPTEIVPTSVVTVEQEPKTQIVRSVSTVVPPVIDGPSSESELGTKPQVKDEVATSLLSFIVLIALLWTISSAYLADKRPAAIRAIAKTIYLHRSAKEKEEDE
jgi:hypothetical protein